MNPDFKKTKQFTQQPAVKSNKKYFTNKKQAEKNQAETEYKEDLPVAIARPVTDTNQTWFEWFKENYFH